jgi:hypothetical protein
MAKIQLPDRNTDAGAETRLLMAECKGPSFPGYTLATAKSCMQLMDRVLYNRLETKPGRFGARGATTVVDIIKAPGQFAGFESYPNYSGGIRTNLQTILDIANNPKDKRSSAFADFVNAAIDVAQSASILDDSPGYVVFWRTQGAGGPGGAARNWKTVGGNTFYYMETSELD